MDTADTEWRTHIRKYLNETSEYVGDMDDLKSVCLDGYFNLEEIAEIILTSRDTYWKERVKMSIGGINFRRQIKGAFEDYAHAHPEVPQFNSDVRRGIEKRLHTNVRTLVLSKLTHKDI